MHKVQVLGNGGSELPVDVGSAGSSAALLADLMLSIHQPSLDPLAVFLIGAYRLSIEELGQGGFDLLVDFAELVGVFGIRN